MERRKPFCQAVAIYTLILALATLAQAQYAGGSGTADDPYQIASAQDLIDLGDTPDDYDKHFILTADIDLSDYLFDHAVIAPDTDPRAYAFGGPVFAGVLAGNHHTIRSLHIEGEGFSGLFGWLADEAVVSNLTLEDVTIQGTAHPTGSLAGQTNGAVLHCHSTGTVTGVCYVGGLVGVNYGALLYCTSHCTVTGRKDVGGLAGRNVFSGMIANCYCTGPVTGVSRVGGLIGYSAYGNTSNCYSISTVTSEVTGHGLIGHNQHGTTTNCFWNTDTSGQTTSEGGTGATTAEMQTLETYLNAGWDFSGESGNGTAHIWHMPPTGGYPELNTFAGDGPTLWPGQGTLNAPFLIASVQDLVYVSHRPMACYRLVGDIDLSEKTWCGPIIPWFSGHFDGNGHTMDHLHIEGESFLGLFGSLAVGSSVANLNLENGSVAGESDYVSLLVGRSQGTVVDCQGTGQASGKGNYVGGLVGYNVYGTVFNCYSAVVVTGEDAVGGLVGDGQYGNIANCCSASAVTGGRSVGGLIGSASGSIWNCCSTGPVAGNQSVGGLVGGGIASVVNSYSISAVTGNEAVGGLIANTVGGAVTHSFWNTETSGVTVSDGGTGLTTAQMQNIDTYREAGWDFLGFSDDGLAETWQISTPGGYPQLSIFGEDYNVVLQGQGTPTAPFVITNGQELGSMAYRPLAYYYRLDADIDLSDITWGIAVVPWFTGCFDGNDHVIRHLHIQGAKNLGLFGSATASAVVMDLGLEEGSIESTRDNVGSLAGYNFGHISNCYSTMNVTTVGYNAGGLIGTHSSSSASISHCYCTGTVIGGRMNTGGLVGLSGGSISNCYSTSAVIAERGIGGGLVGGNSGSIQNCYSTGSITGETGSLGGLVGSNDGTIRKCYSISATTGGSRVGGLVGYSDEDEVIASFWDTEASGVAFSSGGAGLTTAEMMDPEYVGLQGWANDPNWVLDPHEDYPRLAWENTEGQAIPAPVLDWIAGEGTSESPYEIDSVDQWCIIGKANHFWDKNLVLTSDVNMADILWPHPIIPRFRGVLNGNGHAIRNLRISGDQDVGLIGRLQEEGAISNLALLNVRIWGEKSRIGGLVGHSISGAVSNCSVTGLVRGDGDVGGLVGHNRGACLSNCYSEVETIMWVVGAGGLAGSNNGDIINCYSSGVVWGLTEHYIGGLIGCKNGNVVNSFWDVDVSGQAASDGGIGLTTDQMQRAETFLGAGWDFVGEEENGTEDLWWIDEGRDYPRLWWERPAGEF